MDSMLSDKPSAVRAQRFTLEPALETPALKAGGSPGRQTDMAGSN